MPAKRAAKKVSPHTPGVAPDASKEEKAKHLAETVEDIKEKFGEGAIVTLGDARKVDVDAIPTGSFSLDMALGVGGIPRGRVIELYGPESSGKTTVALHIVAEAQKKGGVAAFVDAEHALDPEYAKKIGVKVNDLLISQPDTGEQALQIVESLVRSGSVDIIVVDSVAALTPRAEIEGEIGDVHVGLQARLMSQALRKLTAIVAQKNCIVVFINQIRMQIGVTYGNPETTPGGKALKFYSSVRIEVRRIAKVQKGEEIVGSRTRAKIVKNKVAAPFRTAEFDIIYNEGIARMSDLINTGVKYGVVERKGSSYSYDGVRLGQGIDNARQFLKENPKTAAAMEKAILAKAR
jgi:recombination protein RecA